MWHGFLQALCLVLVLEGAIPFLYPAKWRQLVARLAQIGDHQLRWLGLLSMVFGAVALGLVNAFAGA